MISINNIALFLGKEKPALLIENLDIEYGLWALVGRNGAGKSTFLNSLINLESTQSKKIKIQNKFLSNFSAKELAQNISVVYSKSSVFGNQLSLDILFLGRIPYQGLLSRKSKDDIRKVDEIIELLQLQQYVNKQFNVLSDGEKQLIMIGRALIQDTAIILLDEPTAFLDVVNRKLIINILNTIVKSQQKTILFSTHNIDLIEQYCDGVILIHNHKISKIDDIKDIKNRLEKVFHDEV